MKWLALNNNTRLIASSASSAGESLLIIVSESGIGLGPGTEYSKTIYNVNRAGRKLLENNWKDFTYNKNYNTWYRPIGSVSISELLSVFSGSKIVDLNESKIFFSTSKQKEELNESSNFPTKRSTVPYSGINGTQRANNGVPASDIGSRTIEQSPPNERALQHGHAGDLFGGDGERVSGDDGEGYIRKPTSPFLRTSSAKLPGELNSPIGRDSLAGSSRNWKPDVRGIDQLYSTKAIRIKNNLSAISLIDKLESERRSPTNDETKILLGYSGWGGLINEINEPANIAALNTLLSKDSIYQVQESALSAYYTRNSVTSGIWDLLKAKGYTGGLVCETSAGTGSFLNQRLNLLDDNQHFTAIEKDKISAKITSLTNPDSIVLNQPYEIAIEGGISETSFDLTVGNFPFGEMKLYDKNLKSHISIHNFFLMNSLAKTREGGIVSIITSTHTLDSSSSEFREKLHLQADLLAVVRMPNGLFDDTQAQADLLVFRKRFKNEPMAGISFLNLSSLSAPAKRDIQLHEGRVKQNIPTGHFLPVEVNECFVNPDYRDRCIIAGDVTADLKGYGTKLVLDIHGDERTVINAFKHIEQLNDQWFDGVNTYLKNGIPRRKSQFYISEERPVLRSFQLMENNELIVISGADEVIDLENDKKYFNVFYSDLKVKKSDRALLADYIVLRNCALDQIRSEGGDQYTDEALDAKRVKLNSLYSSFVNKHGNINNKNNRRIFRADALCGVVLGLESYDEINRTYLKADIFTKRVFRQNKLSETAQTLAEAALLSFAYDGAITKTRIESLMGVSLDAAMEYEPGILFFDPEDNDTLLHRISYLHGDVKTKLEQAVTAAKNNDKYNVNVDELLKVQPADILYEDIKPSMGATWIPNTVIESFLIDFFKTNGGVDINVSVTKSNRFDSSKVIITQINGAESAFERCNRELLGTTRCSASRLIMAIIDSSPVVVRTTQPDKSSIIDDVATLDAKSKVEDIKEYFKSWIWLNEDRRVALAKNYNEKLNRFVYEMQPLNGSYPFPGLAAEWVPRAHQELSVVRGLMLGNTLNAHAVGAGKTMSMVMLAMELSRLGIANKPCITVLNHTLYQIANEAASQYPNARILVVTKEDLQGVNRSAFIAKAAGNKWDLIVISYSLMEEISAPTEFIAKKIKEEAESLRVYAKNLSGDDRKSHRQIQTKIVNLESKLSQLSNENTKNPLSISDLGIDAILYDECHRLKNLLLDMPKNIEGVSNPASQIAFNEYIKMQYIRERYYNNEEFGCYGYSATPINNTIAELYTVQRMYKPSTLSAAGIENFNDWVSNYGDVITSLEVKSEGEGYHFKSRLSGFINFPELCGYFRSFTDVLLREDLNIPTPDYKEHVVTTEPTKWQKYYMGTLVERADAMRSGKVSSGKKGGDNFLKIVGEGRRVALSIQAVLPNAPRERNNKLESAAVNIAQIYDLTSEKLGTQVVFCDESTPGPSKMYDVYNDTKQFLIEFGVAENEIGFIHDAATDEQKQAFFEDVRSGKIRIAFGSSDKLGTGTNFQRLLVAAHDLDCPWKPSMIEQRLGRTVRFGNLNPFVDIYRYTTTGSFDVFMWDTNRRKAVALNAAFRNPKLATRTFSEDSEIDYNAIIAATSDNQIVREKNRVDSELMKLRRKESMHISSLMNQKQSITYAEHSIARLTPKLKSLLIIDKIMKENIVNYPSIDEKSFSILYTDKRDNKELTNDELFERKKAQFFAQYKSALTLGVELEGEIEGIQANSSTCINYSHVAKSISKIIQKVEINEQTKIGKMHGCDLNILANGYAIKFIISLDNTNLHETKYFDFNDKNEIAAGAILRALSSLCGHDLEDDISHISKILSRNKEELAAPRINEIFAQQNELDFLKIESQKIDAEIMRLAKEGNTNKREALPDVKDALEAWSKCSDKENFDPSNHEHVYGNTLMDQDDLVLDMLLKSSEQRETKLLLSH